jgi:hypothetical protein
MNSALSLIYMSQKTLLPGHEGEPEGRKRTILQLIPGPSVGVITRRGWRGRPSRENFIGCGGKAGPFGPLSGELCQSHA